MARMHSRDKGKSGSNKPSQKKDVTWIRYENKELELMIVKLSKEGLTPSKIGLVLRDSYGIPSVKDVLGKSILAVLKAKDLEPELPEDLLCLIKKSVLLDKHLEENNPDNTAKRGLRLTQSKIGRLVKYYKKSGALAKEWKYDKNRFKLMAE